MAFVNHERYTPALNTAKRIGFLAALFSALRAGASVRSGRKPATSGPLHFHGSPRAF